MGPVRRLQREMDLKELARRLSRIFPDLVSMSDDSNSVTVMGRIRVTPEGVAEGSGPAADRVRAIFEEFARDQAREQANGPASLRKEERARNPFRCKHCGLRLTSGRVYRRTIEGSVMLFCCRQCADHEEAEIIRPGVK